MILNMIYEREREIYKNRNHTPIHQDRDPNKAYTILTHALHLIQEMITSKSEVTILKYTKCQLTSKTTKSRILV